MKKLQSLHNTLIDEAGLGLQPDKLQVYVTEGRVISHQGNSNAHFKYHYQGQVIITDWQGDIDRVIYIVLQWLNTHEPNHKNDALQYELDIIDHQKNDVMLSIPLTETVKASHINGAIKLQSAPEAELIENTGGTDSAHV